MAKYETGFISENKAPKNNNYIYVYGGSGLTGKIKTSGIKMPVLGNKLYSFGALSDVHVTVSTFAMQKFKQALEYLNDTQKVVFTCIAGDLTSNGTPDQFTIYRNAVAEYSPNTPVYECTGNHDVESTSVAPFLTKESTQPYTGSDMYYSFTQGNDVFIMFGMSGWIGKTGDIFTNEALQWLYETLEENRNRRCFVFEHCPNMVVTNGLVHKDSGSGSVVGLPAPTGNLLNQGSTSKPFRDLMAHYKNVIWFHGHTHMDFVYQEQCSQVNYERKSGCHSIHIPSLASGRALNEDGSGWVNPVGSYGYVVDVYENYIVLRGRDFLTDKFLPIATYCLDTSLQNIEANTFTDSTGIITG